ncbi:MAG: cobalamin-dependent protein, partial [Actinomycetia bacterium]|nr:cobalamin-dependent protein [Actinomycetes bacterium]
MKILFIFPNFRKHVESHPELEDNAKGYLWGYASIPGLGIPHLAANTPEEDEIVFIDDQFEDIDYNIDVDLVAISVFTPQFSRAVVISKEFKKKNIPVIMGGKHITNCPDEALKYCDHVIIGEGELLWREFLEDFKQGNAKKKYIATKITDVTKLPLPNRAIVNENNYAFDIGTLVTVRGCGLFCNWCALDMTEPRGKGNKVRLFDIDYLIKDALNSKFKYLYLPCNTIQPNTPIEFINDLFAAFKDIDKKFILATNPIDLESREKSNPGFFKMMVESGVDALYYTMNNFASVIP